MTLPIPVPADHGEVPPAARAHEGEDVVVLVVDDEEGMRNGVERVLRRHKVSLRDVGAEVGFRVSQAATGEEARAAVAATPPDILLLDYMLPGITGLELMEQLGPAVTDKMLVVMISAYASIETAMRAAKHGAYDFLAKPFTPDELKATMAKATARIMLERRARALAEEKRQIRFRFVSVLGHELKAPIGAIEGYLHLMKDRTLGEGVAAYDEFIERCLKRADGMKKLILDLLDLTRIESGQRKRAIVALDLAALARDAVETVAPLAGERDIRIDLSAPDTVMMSANVEELSIVLSNLLTNAVKYNRNGGTVSLRVAREGERCLIEVADTGVGMGKEDSARLFGEFVRIKNAATRNVAGSGLGLSIVKKIVALYDGDVSLDTELGVGSTFRIALNDAAVASSGEDVTRSEATERSVPTDVSRARA
jgi:two-component system sensor histidine kinase/response regulator